MNKRQQDLDRQPHQAKALAAKAEIDAVLLKHGVTLEPRIDGRAVFTVVQSSWRRDDGVFCAVLERLDNVPF